MLLLFVMLLLPLLLRRADAVLDVYDETTENVDARERKKETKLIGG